MVADLSKTRTTPPLTGRPSKSLNAFKAAYGPWCERRSSPENEAAIITDSNIDLLDLVKDFVSRFLSVAFSTTAAIADAELVQTRT
jgi:hypothetical protein